MTSSMTSSMTSGHGADIDSRVPTRFEDFVNPQSTALVMWDMQKGLAGNSPNLHGMVAQAKRLVEAADKVGVLVIWSRHTFPPMAFMPGPWLHWMMKLQGVDRPSKVKPMFEEGSEEIEFLPDLRPSPHHLVIQKGQPSLFFQTPLESRLKVRGIKSLVMTGFATDIGVEFTARHALAHGYFVIVAEDAVSAYTAEAHDRSIAFLKGFTEVTPSARILEAWAKAARR